MDREQIDKIIEIFRNDENTLDDINQICSIIGMKKFTMDEAIKMSEDEQYEENCCRNLMHNIEKRINLEDRDYFYENLDSYLIAFIGDEEKKIEYINNKKLKSYEIRFILKTLQDENKIKYLEILERDIEKLELIKSLSNDEAKIKCLEIFESVFDKLDVIKSLSNDEAKIKCLEILESDFEKLEVIKSFANDDNKTQYLDFFKDIQDIEELIESIKDADKRSKCWYIISTKRNEEIVKVMTTIYKFEKSKNQENKEKYIAFGLPKEMTIGIEIETEGSASSIVARRFKQIAMYSIKNDASLIDGLEVISPIMKDTSEYVNGVYNINKILQELTFSTSERCGGHVHIGADYLKSVEEIKELLEIWGNAEEIFYLISNEPGKLPRGGTKRYAQPISSKIEKSNLKQSIGDDFIEDAKNIQGNRYSALNLMNVNNGKNTIEFRLSNGTVDPNVWIENIRLYGRTVQIAHEISQIKLKMQKGETITEKETNKLQMKEILKKEVSKEEKIDSLMGLLFDKEERKVYEERFVANKELEEQEHILEEMSFGKVDFEEVYENTDIPKDIIKELMQTERLEEQVQEK